MNHFLSFVFISSLLLVFFTGFCVADEAPGYQVFIQGDGCSISKGSNSPYVITVKDIVPYFHITDGGKDWLISAERLTNLTYPVNAALVLSAGDNETTMMVQVTNVSLPDRDKGLTIQADPLPYYDGGHLQSFDAKRSELKTIYDSNYSKAAIYMEFEKGSPLNGGANCLCDYDREYFCCQLFFPFEGK
jgi:hypothetical protein